MKLSVVIPVYNEVETLEAIVEKVQSVGVDLEIVLVDDGSTDGSAEVARELGRRHENLRALHHAENRGKGAALRTAFGTVEGDVVLIQDADLEYDPADYEKLLGPIRDGLADVVFGSRFVTGDSHRVLYFWHSVGNRFLTLLSNMLTNLNLTDMEVCYKVFRREVLDRIEIEEDRFGFEPEFTAKMAKQKGIRVYEVGISYAGRTYEEGKKIGWRDGVHALVCILKYNLFRRRSSPSEPTRP